MLILYILICWGISNIVCNEFIFQSLKERIKIPFFQKLFSCSTCFGMYLGFILFFFIQPFVIIPILDPFFGGVIISGINNIIENIKIRMFN